jgi:hypothetical protein
MGVIFLAGRVLFAILSVYAGPSNLRTRGERLLQEEGDSLA